MYANVFGVTLENLFQRYESTVSAPRRDEPGPQTVHLHPGRARSLGDQVRADGETADEKCNESRSP